MQSYTYLLIDLGCVLFPFLASFYSKHAFYKQWKSFFIANAIIGFIFLVWDEIFTQNGFWGFNPDYLTGIYVGHLPIEEILFFICIPYACSFTYFAFQYLLPNKTQPDLLKKFNVLLAISIFIVGLVFYQKWYTVTTFISLALFLSYLHFYKIDLYYYYLAFGLILPFFFISNGILTGSFIEKPIVWYNDLQNIGIRMFTIPVEDTFYGMLLIFSNIYLQQKIQFKFDAKS